MDVSRQKSSLWDRVPLAVLLVVSLALNVVLTMKLRSAPAEQASRMVHPSLGDRVPAFGVTDLSGKHLTMKMTDAGPDYTVLYIFTPSCAWCALNLPNLRSLSAQGGRRYRLLTLSLTADNLQDYIKERNLNFPIYTLNGNDGIPGVTITGTPETLVVSKDGRVVASWAGRYSDKARSEIEQFLAVRLPATSL